MPPTRPAVPDDLEAIARILNDAILHTTAVFFDAPKTGDEMAAWFAAKAEGGWPVLVAGAPGDVLGYATCGPFRPWPGYRLTVEHSLYVREGARRQGLGRALLEGIAAEAARMGMHATIGGIEATNGASLALHARQGFQEVGRLPEVGQKFGRWLTLVFMQKTLDGREVP
ncbi:MAG: N-acetyltransferase [Geminicoccaceae bacterium]|nr:N-acetyltransferase [Geminicoccaceae bacterium]